MTKDDEKFFDRLVEYSALKEVYKKRCRIFQVEQKETLAKFFGLPINTLYHVEYQEYLKFVHWFNHVLGLVYSNFANFCNYYGLDIGVCEKIPVNLLLKSFIDYYKNQTGIKLDDFEYVKQHPVNK